MEPSSLLTLESKECVIHKEVSWNISSIFNVVPMSLLSSDGYPSPEFEFTGAKWQIKISPQLEEKNNILLYLVREVPKVRSVPLGLVEWTVGIKHATGGVFVMESGEENLRESARAKKTLRPGCVVTQKGFTHLKESILFLGHDTVFCILRLVNWTCSHTCTSAITMGPSNIRLMSDFRDLLANGEESDVKFVVRGIEFKAHKAILCARVPVFRVMFQHRMLESLSGTVRIEDCEPDIFNKLLYFVYSGSIHGLCTGDIFNLYSVADKYQVDTLKAECVDMMRSSMSVDTFSRCAALAIHHQEQQLLEHIINYLTNNYKKIISSDSWKTFLSQNPLQANELLVKAIGIKVEPNDTEVQILIPSSEASHKD